MSETTVVLLVVGITLMVSISLSALTAFNARKL